MNVLFVCLDMEGLHGSFLHVMEYAEYYKKLGWNVTIASVYIAEVNRKMAEMKGFQVVRIDNVPDEPYDLVYALHLFLFPALLMGGLRYDKAISMTLSSFAPVEMIPPVSFLPAFDLVSAISREAVNNISKKFSVSPEIFTITPNHIPLDFLNKAHEKSEWNDRIKNVAVISNHYVEELEALKDNGMFKMDFIGARYDNPQFVTPGLLLEYDVVITIGKTVQYALGLGIPVFEYDQFGGCGYITPVNILPEEEFNFSGRKTRRKLDSKNILEELTAGYADAVKNAPILRKLAIRRYSIKKIIENQLATIRRHNQPRPKLEKDGLLFANSVYAALAYLLTRPVES